MHISTAFSVLSLLLASITLATQGDRLVLTPGGYRSKSKVYELPTGSSLAHTSDAVQSIDAGGSVIHVDGAGDAMELGRRDFLDGWIAFAWWLNPGLAPIASFTTIWEVPPLPETDHGQTVFLFNALQPNGSGILQPVLQYGPSGAGGGSFWAVATWHVDDAGNAFFTPLVPVSPGQILNAAITLTNTNGSTFDYNAQFTNVPGTSMNLTGAPQLTFAAETLEAYGVTALSDYPSGSTVFSGIDLTLAGGVTPSIAWSHQDDAADGVSISIDVDGATQGRMTITY
ncbi:hypothetical protein MSAN_00263700 [Mycena sanguinolenta]|uniref:Uncharacterized protein n=1 Tax=Mycena sanguinolenta TaxID=230812 RepID=A0A8H6ZIZ3_9AGAR|nr:hypothetical protein MSAN_00263700 [Mycena sanguinolenta]